MITIKLKGFNELERNFRSAPGVLKSALTKALDNAAVEVRTRSRRFSPVRTGTLRRSINETVKYPQARIGPGVHYAPYVEFGTRFMKARPYMKPGAESSVPEITRILNSAISTLIRHLKK